jgi:hypothetical protein
MSIKPYRVIDGQFDYETLLIYPNLLVGKGASCVTHKHAQDHVSIVLPELPIWLKKVIKFLIWIDRYQWLGFGAIRCEILIGDKWQKADMKSWDMFYIPAGYHHRFVQTRKNGRARFICMFSKWGPNGKWVDPKTEQLNA